MKNSTLLRLNIRNVLAQYCSGNEHDISDDVCEACESMEDDLVAAVQQWRMHAYGISKGKI
jgi:hypothetical protein